MTITPNQLKLFWFAAKKLRLSDAAVRVALVQIAGVESSKDLDADGFAAMLGYFEWLGFRPGRARGEDYGRRPGMASFAQMELIRDLWHEYTRGEAGEAELTKWLVRSWGISSLRFLDATTARKAITALKAMKQRNAA